MLVLRGCTELKIESILISFWFFFLFLFFSSLTDQNLSESIVGMLEILMVLLWGLRVSRCLCSHETCWGQLWIASWDSSSCQELEADGCQDIMSEVTQNTEGFSWLQIPLPQPETPCGVMLGRVQEPLLYWMGGTPALLMSWSVAPILVRKQLCSSWLLYPKYC